MEAIQVPVHLHLYQILNEVLLPLVVIVFFPLCLNVATPRRPRGQAHLSDSHEHCRFLTPNSGEIWTKWVCYFRGRKNLCGSDRDRRSTKVVMGLYVSLIYILVDKRKMTPVDPFYVQPCFRISHNTN